MKKNWGSPEIINLSIEKTAENDSCPLAEYIQGDIMMSMNNPEINPGNCKYLRNGLCYHEGRFNNGNGKNWPCKPAPATEDGNAPLS